MVSDEWLIVKDVNDKSLSLIPAQFGKENLKSPRNTSMANMSAMQYENATYLMTPAIIYTECKYVTS